MEHILQFGISIDDNTIRKTIEQKAEQQIIDRMHQQVTDKLFQTDYWGKHAKPENGFSGWMSCKIDRFLNENKDAIIECAGKQLAERLARTKAARELLKEV